MSPRPAPPCPHEPRPGTTVCLRCRASERSAARKRRRHTFARIVLAAAAAALLGAAGLAGASVLQRHGIPVRFATVTSAPRPAAPSGTEAPAQTATLASDGDAAGAPASAAMHSTRTTASAAPLAPVIGEGRTALADGMFAERAGDTVRVHFDMPMTRTRRPDKFERIVRATLPAVYGPRADSVLAAAAPGVLAPAGLVADAPERGIHLPVSGGWTMSLWPETRPGHDGPLVVTYRVIVSR